MNIEEYIKGLAPELQERARACEGVEELLVLAKEAKIPIPDEALEAIAGGEDFGPLISDNELRCPKCGSDKIHYRVNPKDIYYICEDCLYRWKEDR